MIDDYPGVLPGPLIAISEDELKQIGQSDASAVAVRLPQEYGGGFVASIEVFRMLTRAYPTSALHYQEDHTG